MNVAFFSDKEIEINDGEEELELMLNSEEILYLNENLEIDIKFIKPKAMGGPMGSQIFISFFATLFREALINGTIEIIKQKIILISETYREKNKGRQDPTPYMIINLKSGEKELSFNMGNINDDVEVKKHNVEEAFDFFKDFFGE